MDKHRLCLVQILLVLPIICAQGSFGNIGNMGNIRTTGNIESMGKFQEVFAWKQLTYNIEGDMALQSRYSADVEGDYSNDRNSQVYFNDDDNDGRNWNQRPTTQANTGSALSLASITVDVGNNCMDTFAYIPDLTTYGLIVYSLRDNDSWRLTHNYFHFNPIFGNLNIRGLRFQWSDGIFSVTLGPSSGGCRTAYFHPLISTQEFSVSTCLLQNRSASDDPEYFSRYNVVGERGDNRLSTMHEYHAGTSVMFFAEIGRNAVSCWNSGRQLNPNNVALLAMDGEKLSYPSDLHITDDEVWVMSNKLPIFSYANLSTSEYNFYVHKANIQDLISGTVCFDSPLLYPSYGSSRYQ